MSPRISWCSTLSYCLACPVEPGLSIVRIMKTFEKREEKQYISPELDVLVISVEKGVLSQTEPIIDDPDEPM